MHFFGSDIHSASDLLLEHISSDPLVPAHGRYAYAATVVEMFK